MRIRNPPHALQTNLFGRAGDCAPQLMQLMITWVVSIDNSACAAQLPERKTKKALDSCAGSIPASGPTSILIRATTAPSWVAAIAATCVSKAWQMDNSCTHRILKGFSGARMFGTVQTATHRHC
jgi:hypothetical protein